MGTPWVVRGGSSGLNRRVRQRQLSSTGRRARSRTPTRRDPVHDGRCSTSHSATPETLRHRRMAKAKPGANGRRSACDLRHLIGGYRRYQWCETQSKCDEILVEVVGKLLARYPNAPQIYRERAHRVLEESPPSQHLAGIESLLAMGENEWVDETANDDREDVQRKFNASMEGWARWRAQRRDRLEEEHSERVATEEARVRQANYDAVQAAVAAAEILADAAAANSGRSGSSTAAPVVHDHQGCCSYHRGMLLQASGAPVCDIFGVVVCRDREPSPTCRCR